MKSKINKSIEAKDVFISYRRKDGATAARLLYDVLDRRQISVFFDRESIGAGNFDDALKHNLGAAKNIIIVVSQEMFSPGLKNGTYDIAAVEGDWVYKEIQISLEAGKNIIPVFVNGVDGFPQNLPEQIKEVARKDALKLNHEHFDAEMDKLISRLITPRHRLLTAYFEVEKEVYLEPLDNLLQVAKRLSNNDANKAIEAALTKIIRSNWDKTSLTDEQALDALFEGRSPSSIKSICRKLKLDDTGGLRRIRENFIYWLKNKKIREYKKSASESDRLLDVISAFAEHFKSTEDRKRVIEDIENAFENRVELDSKRSSWDVFYTVFQYGIDIEEFFNDMERNLQEQDIKFICDRLSIDSRGRKKELIGRVVDFANYVDDTVAE